MSSHGYGTFFNQDSKRPKGEHWAIIELRHITIPGDERSRQAPGHGYPEHTESLVNYEYFTDEAQFKETLTRRLQQPYNRDRILGLHVTETFAASVVVTPEASR